MATTADIAEGTLFIMVRVRGAVGGMGGGVDRCCAMGGEEGVNAVDCRALPWRKGPGLSRWLTVWGAGEAIAGCDRGGAGTWRGSMRLLLDSGETSLVSSRLGKTV